MPSSARCGEQDEHSDLTVQIHSPGRYPRVAVTLAWRSCSSLVVSELAASSDRLGALCIRAKTTVAPRARAAPSSAPAADDALTMMAATSVSVIRRRSIWA